MQIHMFMDLIKNILKHKLLEIGYYIEEIIYLLIIEENHLGLGLDQLNLVLDYIIIELLQMDLLLIL